MGRKKADLRRGDRYQDVVAAWRMAEAVVAYAFEQDAPRVLLIESDDATAADDVIEHFQDRRVEWQVKHGGLSVKDVTALLTTETHTQVVLCLSTHVRVKKLGPTDLLQRLAVRAHESSDLHMFAEGLHKNERALFDALPMDDDASRYVTLRHLRVQVTGNVAALIHTAQQSLRRVFVQVEVESVWRFLLEKAQTNPGGHEALETQQLWSALRERELQRNIPRAITGEDRHAYLNALRETLADRRVLHPVRESFAIQAPLQPLWIPRTVRRVATAMDERTNSRSPEMEVEGVSAVEQADVANRAQGLQAQPLTSALMSGYTTKYALVGPVGSGKTEELHRAAHELAVRAIDSDERPTPVLVTANDLVGAPFNSKEARPTVFRLWSAGRPLIWLVDGIDEVSPKDQGALTQQLHRLAEHQSTFAVVATSRPSEGNLFLTTSTLLELEPWTHRHTQLLARRAHEHDARLELPRGAQQQLAGSPLLATLAMLPDNREATSSFELLQRLCKGLFVGWASARELEIQEANELWERLQPILGEVALSALRSGETRITDDALRNALRRLDFAERFRARKALPQFGLLEQIGTDHRFAMRIVAEHLAGIALSKTTTDVVLDAELPMLHVPLIQACGRWSSTDQPEKIAILFRGLLQSTDRDFAYGILTRPMRLHALFVALDIACEHDRQVARHAQLLGEVAARYVAEENSIWVGDEAATAVGRLLALGGDCAHEVEQALLSILALPTFAPARWLSAQPEGDPMSWAWLITHRDSNVRAVATQHLGSLASNNTGQTLLLHMFGDASIGSARPPASLIAAFHLRHADRSQVSGELLEHLRAMLDWPGQIPPGAAAIALRPDEAEPDRLARALARLAKGYGGFKEVTEDLARSPGGEGALDKHAPGWRAWRISSLPAYPLDRGERMPATDVARDRCCRALAHCLEPSACVRETLLAEAFKGRASAQQALYERVGVLRTEAIEYLQGGSIDQEGRSPANRPMFKGLTTGAEAALRLACSDDDSWLEVLFDLWERTGPSYRHTFPGRALEPAIVRGHRQAAEIYADWLQGRVYSPLRTTAFAQIPERVLSQTVVAEATQASVLDLMKKTATPDGRGTRLHPGVVQQAMVELAPGWVCNEALRELKTWETMTRERLVVVNVWLRLAGFLEHRARAIAVVSRILRTLLRERQTANDAGELTQEELDLSAAIHNARRSPIATELGGIFAEFALGPPGLVRLQSALALCALRVSPGSTVVAQNIASHWPDADIFRFVPPSDLAPAVLSAPEAFHQRFLQVLETRAFRYVTPVEDLARFLPQRLSDEVKREVVKKIPALHIPWAYTRDGHPDSCRPLDRLDLSRYRLGLPIEGAAEVLEAD